MARGRHTRPGLLARLGLPRPGGRARRRAELERTQRRAELERAQRTALLVHGEAERLRSLAVLDAGRAAAADLRARRAEEQVGAAQREIAELRADVLRLREELLWAFAEGKLPTPAAVPDASSVIDLRAAVRPA